MVQGIRRALRGVRPVDGALAGALAALGVVLMVFNVRQTTADVTAAIADGTMVHPLSTRTWLLVPTFALAPAVVLWWRRGALEVAVAAAVVMAVHDLLFGWVTRCGAGLPLALVLAFLVGLRESGRRLWLGAAATGVLTTLVLVRDATTGLEPLVLALPLLGVVLGLGRAVRHRTVLADELRARTAELEALRDERAALGVADDRTRLSEQLDAMIQARLARLAAAAESGASLPPEEARALFARIESDGRDTLEEMRRVVGLLRGADADLAPVPAMAHLDAFLARRAGAGSRLVVSGDPSGLPPSTELSVYRIVEHLVGALSERPDAPVDVTVRLDGASLEVRVAGRAARGSAVRTALARARERARVAGGSVELSVERGHALAVAALPVPDRV
ncbi:hypothetical protein [Phycicoccus sonneratiae]|uniref:histidine kinase n=1 Tax=Phycicoccus sonneratiae TaxID=2807628 RepID=A0ABS2CJ49_9MICO|nr:hypothetical protein [Phycicoccus sonneraticus]MBM6399810.1 hypothetical protein [Phycicoccus sonneraticus]